jgi:phosphoglycolate phosphatase
MSHDAVLFDLDGTLLDTLEDIADSTNQVLAAFGFPTHPTTSYKLFVGDGEDMLAARALPEGHRDAGTVNRTVVLFQEEYSKRWANRTRPFPGIPSLLDSLVQDGIRLAILSNKAQRFAEAAVSRLLGRWSFEVVLGAQPSLPVKPSPEGALRIARELALPSSRFLYVGDSGVDMKTAASAGMYPVGALWGYRSRDELVAAGALTLIAAPEELLTLV